MCLYNLQHLTPKQLQGKGKDLRKQAGNEEPQFWSKSRHELRSQTGLASLVISCVTTHNLLYLSEPQSSHLINGDNNTCLTELLQLSKLLYVKNLTRPLGCNKSGRYYYFYGIFEEGWVAVVCYMLFCIITRPEISSPQKKPYELK